MTSKHPLAALVAVKPLVWVEFFEGEYYRAETSVGDYYVEDMGPNWTNDRYWLEIDKRVVEKFDSLDVAKAAAWDIHEANVLSTLAPSPAAGVEEALEAASHFIRDHYEPGVDSEYTLLQQVNAALATLKREVK